MDTSWNLIVADAANVTGNLHWRSYQFAAVTGQLNVALLAPVEPMLTPAVATAVMLETRTKRVWSRIGVVVLMMPPVNVWAAVKDSAAASPAAHPIFVVWLMMSKQ